MAGLNIMGNNKETVGEKPITIEINIGKIGRIVGAPSTIGPLRDKIYDHHQPPLEFLIATVECT